jgi:hypothetical protein
MPNIPPEKKHTLLREHSSPLNPPATTSAKVLRNRNKKRSTGQKIPAAYTRTPSQVRLLFARASTLPVESTHRPVNDFASADRTNSNIPE